MFLTSVWLFFFYIAVTHRGALIAAAAYACLFGLYAFVSLVTFRERSSLLSALPISVILMVSHRKDNGNSMAWMILGILFILFFAAPGSVPEVRQGSLHQDADRRARAVL